MRTTPVTFPGRIYDLMTPALPGPMGRVGKNSCGRLIALVSDLSMISAFMRRGSRFGLNSFKSTPLVVSSAKQLLAQLLKRQYLAMITAG